MKSWARHATNALTKDNTILIELYLQYAIADIIALWVQHTAVILTYTQGAALIDAVQCGCAYHCFLPGST